MRWAFLATGSCPITNPCFAGFSETELCPVEKLGSFWGYIFFFQLPRSQISYRIKRLFCNFLAGFRVSELAVVWSNGCILNTFGNYVKEWPSKQFTTTMFVQSLSAGVCVRTNFVVSGLFVVWWLACSVNRRQIEHFSRDVILCGWLGSKYQLTN